MPSQPWIRLVASGLIGAGTNRVTLRCSPSSTKVWLNWSTQGKKLKNVVLLSLTIASLLLSLLFESAQVLLAHGHQILRILKAYVNTWIVICCLVTSTFAGIMVTASHNLLHLMVTKYTVKMVDKCHLQVRIIDRLHRAHQKTHSLFSGWPWRKQSQ